jgi:hypothetical protein
MFRAVPLPAGRPCSKAVYKPVCHIPEPSVQLMGSWWWAEELSETCRGSFFSQNKFRKLVHLLVLLKRYSTVLHPFQISLSGRLKIRTNFRNCEFSLAVRWPSHDDWPARCTTTPAHVRPNVPALRRWDSKPESQGFIRSNPARTLWSSAVLGLRPGLASNNISRTVTTSAAI